MKIASIPSKNVSLHNCNFPIKVIRVFWLNIQHRTAVILRQKCQENSEQRVWNNCNFPIKLTEYFNWEWDMKQPAFCNKPEKNTLLRPISMVGPPNFPLIVSFVHNSEQKPVLFCFHHLRKSIERSVASLYWHKMCLINNVLGIKLCQLALRDKKTMLDCQNFCFPNYFAAIIQTLTFTLFYKLKIIQQQFFL